MATADYPVRDGAGNVLIPAPSPDAAPFNTLRTALGILTSNMAALAAPTVNDDSSQGYGVGSCWRRASTGREWVCVDATPGAAVWQPLTPGFKIPVGSAIQASNVGSVNPTGIGTNPVRTYSPIEINGLGTFDWEIYLTTLAANGEMRVAPYDCDEYGLPGKQARAPVVLDLSTGSASIKAAVLSWTNKRVGRWYMMQHVKPNASQVVIQRIGAGLPGVIPATPAVLTTSGNVQIPRYLTSPEAYGSDPVDATGLTSASVGSDCPVGWLKATA